MTHRWVMHRGLPALRRNQTQRTIVGPGSPRWHWRLKGGICVFSLVLCNYSPLQSGSPPGGLGPCNKRKSVSSHPHIDPMRIPLIPARGQA